MYFKEMNPIDFQKDKMNWKIPMIDRLLDDGMDIDIDGVLTPYCGSWLLENSDLCPSWPGRGWIPRIRIQRTARCSLGSPLSTSRCWDDSASSTTV